jgi:hypothetical protein
MWIPLLGKGVSPAVDYMWIPLLANKPGWQTVKSMWIPQLGKVAKSQTVDSTWIPLLGSFTGQHKRQRVAGSHYHLHTSPETHQALLQPTTTMVKTGTTPLPRLSNNNPYSLLTCGTLYREKKEKSNLHSSCPNQSTSSARRTSRSTRKPSRY